MIFGGRGRGGIWLGHWGHAGVGGVGGMEEHNGGTRNEWMYQAKVHEKGALWQQLDRLDRQESKERYIIHHILCTCIMYHVHDTGSRAQHT